MLSSERILYIDDEVDVRRAFVRTLRAAGLIVDVAANADEAAVISARNRYAVIATDYRMPGEDGLAVIRRLRAAQPDAAYLMITGHTDITLPEACEDAGLISQIIFKPWDNERLVQIIRGSIELHAKRVAKKHVALAIHAADARASKVLVVEDSLADFDLVEAMLRRAPHDEFEVAHASRVSEALTKLHDTHYDAILVDLSLPDARGLTAVAMLHSSGVQAPILVMSGQEDDVLERQAIAIGAQDYLVKGSVDQKAVCRAIGFAVQRQRSQERLAYLANYNPLTGLPNRSLFNDRLAQALVRSKRKHTIVGLMFFDLDRFKAINDTYGHDAGDLLLAEVAERLRCCARDSDTVAHLCGDEFTVIAEDIVSEEGAVILAKRILRALAAPIKIGERDIFVTASIGIATFPQSPSSEQLLKDADDAMYAAKKKGRNQYYLSGPDLRAQTSKKLSLEGELSVALERQEFVLAYQPQIDLATGRMCGAEALLRWQHGTRGLVRPDEFIPLLEETGLIVPVGEWVLKSAAEQQRRWQASGLSLMPVSVNLSARQFREDDFVQSLLNAAGEFERGMIKLELTESLFLDDTNRTLSALEALKAQGFTLSVDDFGTGYSSLGSLDRYPMDEVKIDRSFIKRMATDQKAKALTAGVISLSHNIGLTVLAEGVETAEQLDFLREHACDQVQGFLYARPMFPPELEQWWSSQSSAAE